MPMVSREPMSDITSARKGTQQAAVRQASAIAVLTAILRSPSDIPARFGPIVFCWGLAVNPKPLVLWSVLVCPGLVWSSLVSGVQPILYHQQMSSIGKV